MNEDYVYRKKIVFEMVKVPEGYVRCPECNGSGEIPYKYVCFGVKPRVETFPCPKCLGKGYIKKVEAGR